MNILSKSYVLYFISQINGILECIRSYLIWWMDIENDWIGKIIQKTYGKFIIENIEIDQFKNSVIYLKS